MRPEYCPKCDSNLIEINEDGDYECICGYIFYQKISPLKVATMTLSQDNTELENSYE